MVHSSMKIAVSWLLASLLALQVYAETSFLPVSNFVYPPAAFRPKFRYWLPDASVSTKDVDADIAEIAAVGGGGLEFLPFYNYGMLPASTDWSVYGFGTPAFAEVFKAALNSTARRGLVMDFALGANQGAGVPSPAPLWTAENGSTEASIGLAMELVYGATPLTAGEPVTVGLPAPQLLFNYGYLSSYINVPGIWGDSELLAVLAVEVIEEQEGEDGQSVVVLNETSTVDLTGYAQNDTLSAWTVPEDGVWQLMAFYEHYTNEKACLSVSNASTWLGNGSWTVDHFSAAGAQKITEFWDTYLLADSETASLLQKVGEYSWEDSLEMLATLWWTPGFLEKFEEARGYSAVPYLPIFFQAANQMGGEEAPYNTTYTFSTDGGYNDDYRRTLNEGYQAFLQHYQAWAQGYGLTHSCQPAYNLPLDMAGDVPLVGVPELESLAFLESIDNYLQFTGATHLGGRPVLSTEIGALRIGSYAQTMPEMLGLLRDSFAAGVNTFVLHGFPYSSTYPGTTWPGYTPFQFQFTEMWGPRQPAWRHIDDMLLYTARNSLVLRTGISRVDLAFYLWKDPWAATGEAPNSTLLNTDGYTHEFLGPENLVMARNDVRDGVLSPDGPAYKALVFYGQEKISPEATEALLEMAAAGLPILAVGPLPNTTIGAVGQDVVSANLAKLFSSGAFPNVHVVSQSTFTTDILAAAGIEPRIQIDSVTAVQNASQLYSHWRSDANSHTEFVYLLNRGPPAAFELSFLISNQSTPYVLDAWTGEQRPLLVYYQTGTRLTTNVTLGANETTILAFMEHSYSSLHVLSHSDNIGSIRLDADGHLQALVGRGSEATLQLSNGSVVSVTSSLPSSPVNVTLGPNWLLSVESYAAPDELTTDSVAANRTVLPDIDTALLPWTDIDGLESVSGVGTYTTTFSLTDDDDDTDASWTYTLHLTGTISHTLRAFINDVPVPAFDPSSASTDHGGRDITSLLLTNNDNSTNEIRIEVASTLFNAVKARVDDVESIGKGPAVPTFYSEVPWAEFGLVGDVVIKKWQCVTLV